MKEFKLVSVDKLIISLMWVYMIFKIEAPTRTSYVMAVGTFALVFLIQFIGDNIVQFMENKRKEMIRRD